MRIDDLYRRQFDDCVCGGEDADPLATENSER